MIARSLTSKLAMLVGLLGLIQAVGVVVFSYATISSKMGEQRRQVLKVALAEARTILGNNGSLDTLGSVAHRLADLVSRHDGLHAAVARPNNFSALIAFSPVGLQSLARLRDDTWGVDAFLDWRSAPSGDPMLSVVTSGTVTNGEQYVLILTVDRTADEELLLNFVMVAAGAAPFALALMSLGAWAIVNVGLRPLNRFRDAAISMSARNIPDHINPDGMPRELEPLCLAFNGMLDRVEDGVRRLSQFSADLAHEMRTPLGILLGRTQVVLSQPRTHEQLVELLEQNIEELERLTRIVADMLFLAQTDNSTSHLGITIVDLADEARKVVEYIELVAHERDIDFVVEGEGKVLADVGLVDRAITNLLSNAVRYGNPNSTVAIRIRTADERVELAVTNTGAPVSAEHLGRLFDRFYRADSARSREAGGTGLGLSIVQAIVTLHGGYAAAGSHANGMITFTLSFPLPTAAVRESSPAPE
ncbi:two-component sensor histidine kinase [Massilia varians]|uniref:Sensor protein n=1 Tax=Massilia varians TaxID=457921 RepID=A0ABM8C786_9BURK|nr:heavy metal sensor histidine kinase [Massilia varians]BDT59116.1 two-component sensor histidine kinase [Massilia varians]